MQKQTQQRRNIASDIQTVMFVDIVGYTSTTTQLNRVAFNQLLDVFERLALPVLERFGGTLVKKIGDALLITFRSPTDAVLCGIELQKTFRKYRQTSRQPLRIRVAMHMGEVLLRDNDVYGNTVNTASRIESVAEADQVVFSEAVFFAMNRNEVPTLYMGLKNLKGLEYPIRLFRVRTHADDVKRRWDLVQRSVTQVLVMGIVITLIILILRYLWLYGNVFSSLG
jgi:serine/threonine-protein kinase